MNIEVGEGRIFFSMKIQFILVNISNSRAILKICIHRSFLNRFLFIVIYKGGNFLHTSIPILTKIDVTGCEYFSLCESLNAHKCAGT